MKNDAFSKLHPAVNFLFFLGAICCGVVIQHPAYLIVSIVTGMTYYLLLSGAKGWKTIWGMIPIFLFLSVFNPLFNTYGERVLFFVFGRPYTFEALLYGASIAAMFVSMLLWFGCYNKVLTSDKFTSLFGNLIPAISLLLVMVFRMVPNFMRKTQQIIAARKSIGKGAGEAATNKEKLNDGMTVLGSLTSWALEGSVVTGDSMCARGYGCNKRTSFMIYRMGRTDWTLLVVQILLLSMVILAAYFGQLNAAFTPQCHFTPVSWGIVPYTTFLLIPTVMHIKEALQWHISRSKI